MRITHPIKGYTGPVSVGRRFWFVGGATEAFYLRNRHRRALEEAGFDVVNPREDNSDDDGSDTPSAE